MEKPNMIKLDPQEKSRTYLYAVDGGIQKLTFENVTAICVRDSGSHRLEMADGTRAVVLPGFLAVSIDSPDWTF